MYCSLNQIQKLITDENVHNEITEIRGKAKREKGKKEKNYIQMNKKENTYVCVWVNDYEMKITSKVTENNFPNL